MPKSLYDFHIDPFTCHSLLFLDVVQSASINSISNGLSPDFHKLLCSDIFFFDFITLQLGSTPFNNVRHSTLIKKKLLSLYDLINFFYVPLFNYQPVPCIQHSIHAHLFSLSYHSTYTITCQQSFIYQILPITIASSNNQFFPSSLTKTMESLLVSLCRFLLTSSGFVFSTIKCPVKKP